MLSVTPTSCQHLWTHVPVVSFVGQQTSTLSSQGCDNNGYGISGKGPHRSLLSHVIVTIVAVPCFSRHIVPQALLSLLVVVAVVVSR